jgi:hypothetical protein
MNCISIFLLTPASRDLMSGPDVGERFYPILIDFVGVLSRDFKIYHYLLQSMLQKISTN